MRWVVAERYTMLYIFSLQFINRRKAVIRCAILALCCLTVQISAMASGFAIKNQSAKATAMGNAFAAVADDASAAWYNPAGLAFQTGDSFMLGSQVVAASVDYTDPATGNKYTMDKKRPFIPYIYAGYKINDSSLILSLAVNSPFGLSTDWTNSGAPFTSAQTPVNPTGASNSLTFTELQLLNINPSLVYRMSPQFSMALGVMYFDAQKVAFDSHAAQQHGQGSGWGGNAALMYQSDAFDLGLSYRSRVKLHTSGVATGGSALGFAALNGVPAPVSVNLTTPDMASVGIAFHLSDVSKISLQADWVNWKTFNQLVFQYGASVLNAVTGSSKTEPEYWKAVTSYSIGWDVAVQPGTHLRAGYAFDPTPRNAAYFSPRAVDGDRQIVSLGCGQDVGQSGVLNLAYAYTSIKTIQTQTAAATKRNGNYHIKAQIISADYQFNF